MKIKLNGKKYILPNSLSDITLEQYQKLLQIPEELEGNDKLIQVMGILSNIPAKALLDITYSDFEPISRYIASKYHEILQSMNSTEYKLKPIIKIKGVEYGFINDIKKISTAEYLDLDTFSKDIPNNLPLLLSVLYRPIVDNKKSIGKKIKEYFTGQAVRDIYKLEKYDFHTSADRADLFMQNIYLDTILGAILFFSRLKLNYLNRTLASLKSQSQEMKKKQVTQE